MSEESRCEVFPEVFGFREGVAIVSVEVFVGDQR